MAENKKLRVKLVKSTIGGKPVHRANAEALGLRRLNQEVVVYDTPQQRGKIQKIIHLVQVEEVAD